MTGLLDGIRVLEVAVLFNGDVVGQHLGDLGADVIKIESPGRGDYLRDMLGQIAPHQSPAHLQVNRNKKREKMVAQYAARRAALKAQTKNQKIAPEERFAAQLKLAKLPRNSSKVRIHHRCDLSGRPKGYYRKVKLSRIALRDLANFGQIPGMTKASW